MDITNKKITANISDTSTDGKSNITGTATFNNNVVESVNGSITGAISCSYNYNTYNNESISINGCTSGMLSGALTLITASVANANTKITASTDSSTTESSK